MMPKICLSTKVVYSLIDWLTTKSFQNTWDEIREEGLSLLEILPFENFILDLSSLGDKTIEQITVLKQSNWLKFYGGSGALHWYSLWEYKNGTLNEIVFNSNFHFPEQSRRDILLLWESLMIYILSEKPLKHADVSNSGHKRKAKSNKKLRKHRTKISYRYIAAYKKTTKFRSLTTSNGKRKSPSPHWRRGHFRHLPNGKVVFINKTFVGSSTHPITGRTRSIIKLATVA